MLRIGTLVAVGFVISSFPVWSQEPADKQLDFVRKLREKGYADLALEYLEKLQKEGRPEVKKFVPMEMARTRVALARTKEPEQRLALYQKARTELAAFVKANPTGPEGVQARLELARLVTQEAKALLAKALRRDEIKDQQAEAKPAEQLFLQAGAELDAAVKLLTDLAANYKNPDSEQEKLVRQQADEERLQARFERALNLMDQARTYIDKGNSDINLKRAEIVQKARDEFKKLAELDDKNPSCLLAAAWYIRASQEAQDFPAADVVYQVLTKVPGKVADPAKRWARYFKLKSILEDPRIKLAAQKKLVEVEKEALAWLAAYPAYKNSPEGQGVRFELGQAYYQEAMILNDPKKKDKSKAAAAKFNQAQKVFASLAESDGEFAEEANQINLSISFALMGSGTPVDQLNNFEDCYLKGHYELYQLKKLAGKDAEETEKLKRERLKQVTSAFSRALKLADAKTPPQKKGEARFFLATAYMLAGDQHRAAIANEALARTTPPHKRSAAAAGYALESYSAILGRDKDESNRQRMLQLANFILDNKEWQNDPVMPVTRYQLAMAAQRDGNYKDAIAQLEQLPESYPGFIYAQGQLVFIAQEARSKAGDEAGKKFFENKVLAAIRRIPTLPAGIDPSSAAMFMFARNEYSKFLYGDGMEDLNNGKTAQAALKFKEMIDFNKQLQDQFAKLPVKLTDETGKKVAFTLGVMDKYGKLGLAETEFKAGQYDKVLGPELAGAVVAEVKKLAQTPGQIRMPDFKVVGEVLGLALRANVQKGKVDDAREILKLIERLSGPEGELPVDASALLQGIVRELEFQVKALREAKDAEKLKTTVAKFSSFVDELAKNPGKKGFEPTDYFFLARCYASLDQHSKAAELYGKINEPKALNRPLKKGEKFQDDEEKEIQTYWYAQIQRASQLRQSPEKKDENFKEAQKILTVVMAHKNARGQQLAEKESILLGQDEGKYGASINRWQAFMNKLKPRLEDPNVKEMFFDAYYNYVFSMYKYSQDPKVKGMPKGKGWLARSADFILRLESAKNPSMPDQASEGWQLLGPRFIELMTAEEYLRKQFEELKSKQKQK